MADEMRRLLDTIVQRWVVDNELRAVELDASAAESGEEIETDQQEAIRREVGRAGELAPAFRDGLTRAWQQARSGGNELTLDDRNPEENRIADAMVRFLVSYDLASSHSTETDANHYTYAVTIDWSRLGDVARETGIDLEQVLDRLVEQANR